GTPVNWHAYFTNTGARHTPLPTYPFQHTRYWMESAAPPGTLSHPFLDTAVGLADGDRFLLTGSLSLTEHRWLADHAVRGDVLLPGTAFVELAMQAARHVDHAFLAELTLGAPLVLTEDTGVHIQVLVDEPDTGGRVVSVFSRPADASPDEPWTKHAEGRLVAARPASTDGDLIIWPPAGATALDVDSCYAESSERQYGPAFQGLRRAWVQDDVLFAEVVLGAEQAADADGFAIHPALLDAALHPLGLAPSGVTGDAPLVPFSWNDVALPTVNAKELRVRISPVAPEAVSLLIADTSGATVLDVGRLTLRPLQRGAGQGSRSLFRTSWVRSAQSAPVTEPEIVYLSLPTGEDAVASAAQTLAALQQWLGDEPAAGARLAVLTTGSCLLDTDAAPGTARSLANSALWGMTRSAQSEHPDRFVLVDVDDLDSDWRPPVVAAVAAGENQIAIRNGEAYVPRLVRAVPGGTVGPDWSSATVLITGATGALGGLVARHLVAEHGASELLLAARRPVPAELLEELTEAGAHVTSVVCDLTDRADLAAVLATVPADRPLAVVHCAGVVDDAVLVNQTPEHLERVFPPKATAAWHLHELTRDRDVTAFVLFSSAASVLGSPGQANYAAANAYLDALAHHRTTTGLPTTSLAWGPWATGMAATVAARAGVRPLRDAEGLGLFDAALTAGVPVIVPIHLDAHAVAGDHAPVPPLLRALVPTAPQRAAERAAGGFAERLRPMSPANRDAALLALVRTQVAAVLGHSGPQTVDSGRAFSELGFDSLTSVELRNRLNASTGLQLPSTLVFDHPNASSLVDHLRDTMFGAAPADIAPTADTTSQDDPVVVVGIGCRYPGGVGSAEALWRLVVSGADAVTGFPTDRGWDLAGILDPALPGGSITREGGFLHNAAD
ncbi:SDR family NAD(P)-dependent oxidoreductase, partial [Kitasatospora sp. NPDC087314]|uniref:type I polyketide synthase n=1 Tax=Kitasatospora sp. NPDC087314 TaxID=3364068 RepID=UPI00380282ED